VEREARDQAWMRQWREAAGALAEQRRSELAAMTDAQGLAASQALLALAANVPLPSDRIAYSGLVEFQALPHRRPR
jgi:hypothetical protein